MSNQQLLWKKIEPHLKGLQNPNGQGECRALCPFHKDTVPSLDINPEKGVWYCHGACKRGGSLTDFARELGILDGRPTEAGQKKPATEQEAWAELERRGLRRETWEHFRLTIDLEKKSWAWPVRNGMRFKKWPGYNGRKYWHFAGTPNGLYGLGSVPPGTKTVYYVSGEVDLWVMWQAGLPAVCHIYGEGNPPEGAGAELVSRGFAEVRVVPDLDQAGETQAARVTAALQGHNLAIRVLALPDFLGERGDLNDLYLWCDCDDETFRQAVEQLKEGGSKATRIFRFTDQGNGERLAARHGHNLRYCGLWKEWLIWDGKRWGKDAVTGIERLAKEAVRAITEEEKGTGLDDSKRREEIRDWAHKSESDYRRKAMIRAARSEEGISVDPQELNSDPWLLNVLNGTLDLRTGDLRPHRQEDLITKLSPVEYNPDAELELWDDFLRTATDGNQELIAYLQRAAGYSLAGHSGDEVVFFIHGPARSGKSTFIEAVKAMMGDYAMTATFDTFLKQARTGSPRQDIARLMGARLVTAVETERTGKKMAEALLKALTGGDTICARYLYGREFEFVPIFAPWFATNYAPMMDSDDDALWERLKRIPFEHTISRQERDPNVKATLRNPDIAGPAVLAWAVRGCLAWQDEGLGECPIVEQATLDLRAQMDPLYRFIEDCCILGEDSWVSSKMLRKEYEDWAKENGENLLRGREWGASLRKQGCAPKMMRRKGAPARGWQGIRLATDPDKQGALWSN